MLTTQLIYPRPLIVIRAMPEELFFLSAAVRLFFARTNLRELPRGVTSAYLSCLVYYTIVPLAVHEWVIDEPPRGSHSHMGDSLAAKLG